MALSPLTSAANTQQQEAITTTELILVKQTFAEKTAAASNMKYLILKASDAEKGHYQMLWQSEARQRYLDELIEESKKRVERDG